MRRAYPPVEPRAVTLVLRALKKISDAYPDARASEGWLDFTKQERERPANTPVEVKQNSKRAEIILEPVLRTLEEVHNQTRAERFRGELKKAFGERAYRKAILNIEWERDRERKESHRAGLLPAGVHIAPFLSPAGNVVLVVIGQDGAFGCSAECGPLAASHFNGNEDGDEITAKSVIKMANSADTVMSVIQGQPRENSGYGDPRSFFAAGIHLAPWRPWTFPSGFTLVACDKEGRLLATMDAAGPQEEKSARKELGVLFEMLSPAEPYADGYGKSDCDSDEDFGEEWKKGS